MSVAHLVVDPAAVDRQRPAARAALVDAGLADLMTAAAPGPFGLCRATLDLLEALEASLAAGAAAAAALRARVLADRGAGFAGAALTVGEERFAAGFGLLVGCEEALAATASDEAALPARPFPAAEVAAVLARGDAAALAHDLAGYLRHYLDHPDPERRLGDAPRLRACVRSHLRRLGLSARAACDEPAHAGLVAALRAATLRLPAAVWPGLDRRALVDEEAVDLLDVGPADVVGNAEVLAAGLRLARAVAAFDLASGRNPRVVDNPVLFVLGAPGCGKTVTAHAIGRAFLRLSREAGLPARFRVIRRTDWASHYQNKSANDLLRIFRDEVFGFDGVCGAYWPDIDTAFAARSDPDIRAEEKANLATLFGILDGTVGPRNGKWFLICDANTMQVDDAMISRLTQDPKVARGPETAADYVRLLRELKLRAVAPLLPPAPAWEPVGARLVELGLSGRAVAAVAGRITAELQDVEEPPGFFTLSYDEKVRALAERARPITVARILEHIEHYRTFELEAAEREREERFARRVAEIRLQLSARAAALGTEHDAD